MKNHALAQQTWSESPCSIISMALIWASRNQRATTNDELPAVSRSSPIAMAAIVASCVFQPIVDGRFSRSWTAFQMNVDAVSG